MNFSFLPQFWSYFNYGVLVTIMISVCVVFFGTILGVLVSLAKRSGIKPLEWLVSLYVWVFRGTPMVVQIMIAFNLIHMNLPTVQFGILNLDLSRIVPGIIVLSLNSGAYISEIMRGGIMSVDPGQMEGGRAMGLSFATTMRKIVIPQAVKNILPTLGNEFISLIKETSVVSFVGATDLYVAFNYIGSNSYEFMIPYLVMALIYIVMVLLISLGIKLMERSLRKSDRRH